jgi:hypothetical protein
MDISPLWCYDSYYHFYSMIKYMYYIYRTDNLAYDTGHFTQNRSYNNIPKFCTPYAEYPIHSWIPPGED